MWDRITGNSATCELGVDCPMCWFIRMMWNLCALNVGMILGALLIEWWP